MTQHKYIKNGKPNTLKKHVCPVCESRNYFKIYTVINVTGIVVCPQCGSEQKVKMTVNKRDFIDE